MTNETKYIIGIGLITLAIFVGAVLFLSNGSQAAQVAPAADADVLYRNNKHKITAKGAKVTIVEFADFQCPACGNTYPEIKKILKAYEGKITYVYRHFPLPQHGNAILAAKAAEAAGEQGKFWQMHDKLYENQAVWSERRDAETIFVTYAKGLNLDTAKFTEALQSHRFDKTIQADKEDGITIGVNATPTIYINGKKMLTYHSYENIAAAINDAMKK